MEDANGTLFSDAHWGFGENGTACIQTIFQAYVSETVVKQLASIYIAVLTSFIISHNVRKCPKFIVETLQVILVNATIIPILPTAILVIASVLLYRTLVSIYLRLRYGDKLKLMDSTDVAWAAESPGHCNNFTSLYILKGKCDMAKIRARIQKRIIERVEHGELIYEKLRYAAIRMFGFYCWRKCENFKLEDHVRYLNEQVQQGPCTEAHVFEYLQSIADTPMSAEKSQWETLVVPNFKYKLQEGGGAQDEDFYAVVFRVHHSIMDGVSAGNALRFALADKPMKLYVDPCERLKIHWLLKTFIYIKTALLGPSQVLGGIAFKEQNCFHHQDLTGPKDFAWSRPITIEGLKTIKVKFSATTTAVLMSAVAGALRNIAIKKKKDVPTLVHAAPTIAIFPYPDIRPRNRFVLVHFPLETGLSTAVERLKSAHTAGKELAQSIFPLACFWLIRLAGIMPAFVPDSIINNLHATILLSNVPGPAETSYLFGGDKLQDAVFWAPLKSKTGIGACLFSYAGRVRAAFVSDRSAFCNQEDIDLLVREFESEITNLASLAGVGKETIFWNCD